MTADPALAEAEVHRVRSGPVRQRGVTFGSTWSLSAVRAISWAVPCAGVGWIRFSPPTTGPEVSSTVAVAVVGVLFLLLIGRVTVTAARRRAAGAPLWALAFGLVLWAGGSAVLNSTAQPETVSFPAPGEWLFLAAYIGFSAFLVLDRAGATQAAGGGWLDGLIIVGGTACVALVAVLTPFAADPGGALPLLVALIYPLLDVTLLLLVVAQMALRQRPVGGRGLVLAAAFVVLGIADTSLVASARSGSYQSGELFDVTWCVGFLLLVEAACHRAGRTVPDDVTQPKPGAIPIILAATVALVTLLPQQATGIRLVVVAPALVTLLAAGLRLGLALRQAQQLNEALLLSRTDDLTGLPNRRALNDLLGSDRDSGGHGLLLLDLDGFKEINDTLGHAAGDAVLRAIGSRIRAAVDASALVVRLGGDEFAVAVPQDDPVRLTELAFRLRDAVRKPVRVDGLEVCLDVSIGIAVRDDGTAGVGGLLRRADVAMYQAKTGRAGVLVYDAARDDFSRERLRIAEELRRGIDSGEIVVWYQPKVDATTGAPTGVEALVRWSHPKDGLLPPAAFLPAARRTGLMPALTRAVLAQVISDLARWRSDGLDMHAAVNVAPAELLAPAVMSDLFGMIARAGLGDGSLVIEVTEDSFLADPDRAREVIEAIGARGIEVAIDDFGTGYSSLAYLRDLPVQELKIDRSFVSDILTNPRNEMIVRTTLELGRGLGMRTVAEGVEDEVIAERLRELGVDELQGYHFARPMPPAHLATWLVERTARTVTRS